MILDAAGDAFKHETTPGRGLRSRLAATPFDTYRVDCGFVFELRGLECGMTLASEMDRTPKSAPEWFVISDEVRPLTLQRLAESLDALRLPLQIRTAPVQAFWFLSNSLFLASQANQDGMHANALSITRQCLEAISVIELGLSQVPAAEQVLLRWEADKESAGSLRKWLEANVWPNYGHGLWSEPWSDFMGRLAKAIQPYAHYSTKLAQWQMRVREFSQNGDNGELLAVVECGPRKYDPQKATRITLYHALLIFTLARIWLATAGKSDTTFGALVDRLRMALGKSVYLDGATTNWDQQFWAMLLFRDGQQAPE